MVRIYLLLILKKKTHKAKCNKKIRLMLKRQSCAVWTLKVPGVKTVMELKYEDIIACCVQRLWRGLNMVFRSAQSFIMSCDE